MNKWINLLLQKDEGLQILLFLLVAIIFLVYPLQANGFTNLVLVKVFFSLITVSGIWAVSGNKRHLVLVAVVSVLNLIFLWYRTVSHEPWVIVSSLIFTVLFEGLLILFVLLRTLAPGPVSLFRVQGSVVVYLLIGILFSSVYMLLYVLEPASFNFSKPPANVDLFQATFTYFSFITLTTIGYGDIQPTLPLSQSAAMMEGLIGQLFPAILIARLVSQSIQENHKS